MATNNVVSKEECIKRELAGYMDGTKQLKSVPFDPRFPNTNQTRNCYQNYLDYHRCVKKRLNEEDEMCMYFKCIYQKLCPKQWHETWDQQRRDKIFPGKI